MGDPRLLGGRHRRERPGALALALVHGLGGWLALRGGLEPGTVVTLALLLSRLYGPLTSLANARVDAMSALVSFERARRQGIPQVALGRVAPGEVEVLPRHA